MNTEEKEKLRDELAMSMPAHAIPALPDITAIRMMARTLGLEVNTDNQNSVMEFMENYHALIRYRYADAMLWAREQPKKKLHSNVIGIVN